MQTLRVRRLGDADADAYFELRREALVEAPLALTASPESDLFASADDVREYLRRENGSVIFGAFTPTLDGSVGLLRPKHRKSWHKLTLWGMYVRAAARRHGVAAALLESAIVHARSLPDVSWIQLAVGMPDAQRLYERFGFTVWGTEPDALRHGEVSIAEHHMALRIQHEQEK